MPQKRNVRRRRAIPAARQQPTQPPRASAPKRAKRRSRRRAANHQMPPAAALSDAGLAFLKCAFAPPDFNTDPGKGIPDKYEGKVLSKKDVITQPLAFAAGLDTFILVMPTPGIAYWIATVPVGTFPTNATVFTAMPFPGFSTLFGGAIDLMKRADNVSSFRYASLNVGLYPTSNQMQYAGSITAWKIPATTAHSFVRSGTSGARTLLTIEGLEGAQAVSADNYTHSFIDGLYSQTVNNQPDFEFQPILEGVSRFPYGDIPVTVTIDDMGMPFQFDAGIYGFLGLGTMDTLVMRVSSPTGSVNSAMLKVWACLEYKPNPQAAIYQYAHDSPREDLNALAMYRKVARDLPLAVICAHNATFWERVKKIISMGLAAGSFVPGPVGAASRGLMGLSPLFAGLGL